MQIGSIYTNRGRLRKFRSMDKGMDAVLLAAGNRQVTRQEYQAVRQAIMDQILEKTQAASTQTIKGRSHRTRAILDASPAAN